MKKHDIIKSVWIMAILALSTSVVAARRPATVNLTPEGEKLEAHYSKMLEVLKEEVTRLEPRVDENVKAEFTKQLDALRNVPPITKNVKNHITKVVREVTLKCDPATLPLLKNRRRYFWLPGLF